ncbi:MAG: hypothetical protein IJX76_03420 [Clostridia bacterium]|nr:hypothetical protein [Clostridia bacterium]
MDYKRNARYFSKTFARNMIILAVAGIILATVGGFIWWNIYLGIFDIIVEIAAVAGVILSASAISQRPSDKDLFEQIEDHKRRFREEALEAYGYPADVENCTRIIWGFVPGSVEKITKDGKTITDRVEFAFIWLKKGELAVYRQTVSLLTEEVQVTDLRLSRATLSTALDREVGMLTLHTPDETMVLSVFAPDYKLEEFLSEIVRQKGK